MNEAREQRFSKKAEAPSRNGTAVLELDGVTKHFGAVTAVDDVSFSLNKGQVLALLGDNGAGKSTIVKMISGVFLPDRGSIRLDSRPVAFRNAKEARSAGIATVFQDLGLVPTMNVWRNFFLGAELKKGIRLDVNRMRAETEHALEQIGLRNLRSVDQGVTNLSGGEQQALSIGRAVYFEQKLLILDEPTAALSVKETKMVFEYIGRAKRQGLGVLVIMHNTQQALQVSDRVIVMRHGQVAAQYEVDGNADQNMVLTVDAAISGVG